MFRVWGVQVHERTLWESQCREIAVLFRNLSWLQTQCWEEELPSRSGQRRTVSRNSELEYKSWSDITRDVSPYSFSKTDTKFVFLKFTLYCWAVNKFFFPQHDFAYLM